MLFDDEELHEIQEFARRHHMTLAEWVRQTLRETLRRQPRQSAAKKRQAVRRDMEHEFPTADIDEMIAQIEQGYGEHSS